ncbi:MAG: DEAD/DEAH box helicase [Longimicrobiales bacterium]
MDPNPLSFFQPATTAWFTGAFSAATPVQQQGWASIAKGDHALLTAPTGSGKTLAAFLYAIDQLGSLPEDAEPGIRVLYVSPLKALVYDIERNLRAPISGITKAAGGLGARFRPPKVDIRTGDTSSSDRQRQKRSPGDVLVTTPESLFLILGSGARETLRTLEWIIVDEIHAMAGTKRGAHLALSLERASALARTTPQRIGLSATAHPLDEVGRFLGGRDPVQIIDTSVRPALDLTIEVTVDDMTRPVLPADPEEAQEPQHPEEEAAQLKYGIWPTIHPRLLDEIRGHNSTIVFVNSRGLCERLAQNLNDLAGEELVKAHHGSLAHEQRRVIEEELKAGTLRCIVATSSLELGIDMGAVDLVLLVESPGTVSSGLQRIGRAGHGVGEISIGRIFPKHRGDLLEAAVVSTGMQEGAIEALRIPKNPLDVLAQHIVAMTAVQPWTVADLTALVHRAAPFAELPASAMTAVLDMLSGLYPSHDFTDLRPRIDWDRDQGTLTGRKGSRMLASVNAGTIPDRGLYAVYLGEGGPRVGELDEEMVHESTTGQTFTLGASTWRIVEITRDRVIVEGAPGEPGRLPFWHGDGPGRPPELGRALGAFTREIEALPEDAARERLQSTHRLDDLAAKNLLRYLAEQREATGILPTDRDVVIERFRDELGDWRICILSPFGGRIHAPWALAIRQTVGQAVGYDVQIVWSDDGIVLTLADGDEPPPLDALIPDAGELEDRLLAELTRSPVFATQFRENAARALLLPRRRPGSRTPLFAQRLRAQKLMAIALEYPSFPIVIETFRSCLRDVFDVPALQELLTKIEAGSVRVHQVETGRASPFAKSLVFAYVAAYLYEGDSPAAERRAGALSLDVSLLRELLGEAQLRELLDADVIEEVESELQATAPSWGAKDSEELHDLLRRIGDLTNAEIEERTKEPAEPVIRTMSDERRAYEVRVGDRAVWIAREDLGLYRDALGTHPPQGVPTAYLKAVDAPVSALLSRWTRTRGPFGVAAVAKRFGFVEAQAKTFLRELVADGKLLEGEFRPGGAGTEWCDPDVMRRIKRRTLAKLRGQVAPVSRQVMARFLPRWHEVGVLRRNDRALEEAVARLEGLPISRKEMDRLILPARVPDYRKERLDELGAMGWLVWVGRGSLGPEDGRVALYRRDRVGRLLEPPLPLEEIDDLSEDHARVYEHLSQRGASFLPELSSGLADIPAPDLADLMWELIWAGQITNDSMAGVRALRMLRRSRGKRARRTLLVPGRWSLVADLVDPTVSDTERAHSRAVSLLERHGVVTREAATVEGGRGGFSAIYRVLREMESAGKVRRGYFVEGLGGAQFAFPGTIDRLRRIKQLDGTSDVHVLSATDPANPYGWMMPWPAFTSEEGRGPRRVTGGSVVLVSGHPVLFLDRNGKRIRTAADTSEEALDAALDALPQLARRSKRRALTVEEVDGERANKSPLGPKLRARGFTPDYRGLRMEA